MEIIVKNLIFDTYFVKHFAFLVFFSMLDFIHHRERKVEKISLKCLVLTVAIGLGNSYVATSVSMEILPRYTAQGSYTLESPDKCDNCKSSYQYNATASVPTATFCIT